MVFKITAILLLVFVCSGNAKGIPGTVGKDICQQCRDVTAAVKTQVLRELETTALSDLSAGICDLDDDELRNQCFDLFQNHGDDIRDFLENLDEGAICDEMICKELDQMGLSDVLDNDNLYFRTDMSGTGIDEVGNFICPICKQFMTFIHSFLTGKRHQGFVLHIIKGACHYVPIFRMQCELLVNMYGRLILNLAARYLNPSLCVTFRLCPRHQSSANQEPFSDSVDQDQTAQNVQSDLGSTLSDLSCGAPEDIMYGLKSVVGSTVHYVCYDGYYMASGDASRTCGQDGQWTGETPVCVSETDVDN